MFVGQIQAAGTAITLTAANRAVFVEQAWTPALNYQAVKRHHRIGQGRPVLAEVLAVDGSIDHAVQADPRPESRRDRAAGGRRMRSTKGGRGMKIEIDLAAMTGALVDAPEMVRAMAVAVLSALPEDEAELAVAEWHAVVAVRRADAEDQLELEAIKDTFAPDTGNAEAARGPDTRPCRYVTRRPRSKACTRICRTGRSAR